MRQRRRDSKSLSVEAAGHALSPEVEFKLAELGPTRDLKHFQCPFLPVMRGVIPSHGFL